MSPLDAVWEWYEVACDSMRFAAHRIRTQPEEVSAWPALSPMDTDVAVEKLRKTQAELDDLTVLALFAVFEQALLDRLAAASKTLQQTVVTAIEKSLAAAALGNLDRWPLDDILNVCKAEVDPEVVGLVKQVKAYRDWVAHGKKRKPSARIVPREAHDRLSEFLRALRIAISPNPATP